MRSDQELELLGLVQLLYIPHERSLQGILLSSFFQRQNLFKKHNKPKKLFIKWKDLFAEQTWKGLETGGAPMEEMKS